MKKIIISLTLLFALIAASIGVLATEVALVVEFPNGDVHTECISTTDNANGYEILEASSLNLDWADYGAMGHFLNSVNGISWDGSSFWQLNAKTCNNWFSAQFVWDGSSDCWNRKSDSNAGHYCAINGDVLGLTYDSDFPTLPSASYNFEDICHFGIVDLDVKVDSDSDKNLCHGDRISDDALPGSTIKLKIKFGNFYTDDEDVEIEDITVTVTLRDIDDGDDIDEESEEFDIKADDTETETIELNVPLLVDEDTYELLIEVEGDGDDGTDFDFAWILYLEVDKKNHELMIRRANLDAPTISCSEQVGLSTEIINLGTKEEEDVTVEISAPELGYSFIERNIELDEDPFDEDNSWTTTRFIDIPQDLKSGIYYIYVKAYYDDTRLSDESVVELVKNDCAAVQQGEQPSGAREDVKVVQDPSLFEGITGAVVDQPEETQPAAFGSNIIYLAVLLVVVVVALIAAMLIISYFVRTTGK